MKSPRNNAAPGDGKPRSPVADEARHERTPRRRQTDNWRGCLCWLAARGRDWWDFIDRRQIDKHAVAVVILYGTVLVMRWAMDFASLNDDGIMPGTDIALVIASVVAPYMALQGAAIAYYFKSREK